MGGLFQRVVGEGRVEREKEKGGSERWKRS